MTQADKVKVWRSRLRYAAEKRRIFYEGHGENEDGTRRGAPGAQFAIDSFRGDACPKYWDPQDPFIHIGKLKSAVRAAVPALMYRDPEYKVWPSARDFENGADISMERSRAKALWLNHWWRESHGTLHTRIAIQNAFFDIGVIKSGYLCDFEDSEERGVFAKDDEGNYILDAAGDPVLERGEFLYREDGEVERDGDGLPVLHPGTVCQEKWAIKAIDCRSMLFDVDSGPDFFQHNWVAEEWLRPLESVKNDPRFPRSKRNRLKGTDSYDGKASSLKPEHRMDSSDDSTCEAVTRDQELVRGYDIYDFQTGEYLVLPEEGLEGGRNEEFLLSDPMPEGMEHGPYRFLKYTEDIGTEWYPVPDATDMALVNQEYDITRSQMFIHREHTKTRYLYTEGTFSTQSSNEEEEIAKWAHGPDGTALKVMNINGIMPAAKGQLDGSFFQAVPNIAADFNEVGGMPGEARGVADADSATQASILASGAEIRVNDRRDNQVGTFLKEVGRVLLLSGQANAELDSLVIEKVAEQTGAVPFRARRLTREELIGEFEVIVEVGSTQAKNDPRVLQQILAFQANLVQNPLVGMNKGLNRRILDGMGLDPVLADELYEMALAHAQMQSKQEAGAPAQQGQTLPEQVMGGLGNAAGGAYSGAPVN